MRELYTYDAERSHRAVKGIILFTTTALMLFGLFAEGNPIQSIKGVGTILVSEASLITDYIVVGGLGGAFLNSGLAMLLSYLVLRFSKAEFNGISLACCYIVAGFALFGKNILNMPPIILGTWYFAKVEKDPFSKHVTTALFSTCAGPIVQYCMHHGPFAWTGANLCLGFLLGMGFGIVLPSIAAVTAKIHEGMLIYNGGFAVGFVSIGAVTLLKGFGFEFEGTFIWSVEYREILVVFLLVLFGAHIIIGFWLNNKSCEGLSNFLRYTGRHPNDYVETEGAPVAILNMGIMGYMAIGYILLVGGDMAGPVVGGILTVGGFGGLGKNYYNIIWGTLGIVLMSWISVWHLNEPVVLLGALFCTCICSFAEKYGPLYGIIAGMMHVTIVRHTASMHGWINLYNNGFAGGLVCIILYPIIRDVLKKPGRTVPEKQG